MAKNGKNSRRTDRNQLPGRVRLSWEQAGSMLQVSGKAYDISETGMGANVSERIPVHSRVRIEAPNWQFAQYAEVRHCTQKGINYLVGLEFQEKIGPKK